MEHKPQPLFWDLAPVGRHSNYSSRLLNRLDTGYAGGRTRVECAYCTLKGKG